MTNKLDQRVEERVKDICGHLLEKTSITVKESVAMQEPVRIALHQARQQAFDEALIDLKDRYENIKNTGEHTRFRRGQIRELGRSIGVIEALQAKRDEV